MGYALRFRSSGKLGPWVMCEELAKQKIDEYRKYGIDIDIVAVEKCTFKDDEFMPLPKCDECPLNLFATVSDGSR